ncbi:hypothetical protein TIFTF001_015411 [Ficus carica]|uniref:Uncharacterized protein n=1 Tax=Ficus carica TaxID=3494 RepID=A0AA88AHQ7_FICCA|nr:hypothetical protein TIFTF001_015411 [Ficus carica]
MELHGCQAVLVGRGARGPDLARKMARRTEILRCWSVRCRLGFARKGPKLCQIIGHGFRRRNYPNPSRGGGRARRGGLRWVSGCFGSGLRVHKGCGRRGGALSLRREREGGRRVEDMLFREPRSANPQPREPSFAVQILREPRQRIAAVRDREQLPVFSQIWHI